MGWKSTIDVSLSSGRDERGDEMTFVQFVK